MKRLLLCAVLAASAPAFAQSSIPAAPTLTASAAFKGLRFKWAPVAGATSVPARVSRAPDRHLRTRRVTLHRRAPPRRDFSFPLHLFDWTYARYRLAACNSAGCSRSAGGVGVRPAAGRGRLLQDVEYDVMPAIRGLMSTSLPTATTSSPPRQAKRSRVRAMTAARSMYSVARMVCGHSERGSRRRFRHTRTRTITRNNRWPSTPAATRSRWACRSLRAHPEQRPGSRRSGSLPLERYHLDACARPASAVFGVRRLGGARGFRTHARRGLL